MKKPARLWKKERKTGKKRAALELERLKAEKKADAEMGGGIVNVQGLKITTEVNKSLRSSGAISLDSEAEKRERQRRKRKGSL